METTLQIHGSKQKCYVAAGHDFTETKPIHFHF
jgi:hypothetical protein